MLFITISINISKQLCVIRKLFQYVICYTVVQVIDIY